jgi:hypothetical protein
LACAAGGLQAAHAQPVTRSEPASIAGVAGKAYYSTSTNPSGLDVDVKMVLADLDASHLLAVTELSAVGTPAAQLAELGQLAAALKLER